MDCHETLRVSRNDENKTQGYFPPRHCEEQSDKAIHNLSNQKIFNGEIKSYRFATIPQVEGRNDKKN